MNRNCQIGEGFIFNKEQGTLFEERHGTQALACSGIGGGRSQLSDHQRLPRRASCERGEREGARSISN